MIITGSLGFCIIFYELPLLISNQENSTDALINRLITVIIEKLRSERLV